jgi:hypothetical protein
LWVGFEVADLAAYRHTAIYCCYAQATYMRAIFAHFRLYLHTQFTGGAKHKGLHMLYGYINVV